jgi:hypothetical protein
MSGGYPLSANAEGDNFKVVAIVELYRPSWARAARSGTPETWSSR